MTPDDARARLPQALRVETWRALAPELTITDEPAAPDDGADVDVELRARLATDGFASVPAAASAERVARARQAILAVTRAGWPRVFAWVYDEVWACARAPGVHAALSAALGAGYRQLPGLWVNEVAGERGARGWGPHVDEAGVAETVGDAPQRLTAWLSLTHATVDNGCMYFVPNVVAGDLADRFEQLERVATGELLSWLHHARAAEAAPGTLLLWRTDLFHWGSQANDDAHEPRLALAFEAGHEKLPATRELSPSLDPRRAATFVERLSLIGRGLLAYGKAKDREPFAHAFVPLGEELCDLWLE